MLGPDMSMWPMQAHADADMASLTHFVQVSRLLPAAPALDQDKL